VADISWRHPMIAEYPNHPGAKVAGTSQDAADEMAEHAPTLREQVLALFRDLDSRVTTDEAADFLHKSVLAIRPRFSELRALGMIEPTGERRINASGMSAIVWRIRPATRQPELFP
jgi:hypothetical protein